MKIRMFTAVLALLAASTNLFADQIPDVDNFRVEGNSLVWDDVEGAVGYNLYRDYEYYDTVKGRTSYSATEVGNYDILAFDDAGNFGRQYQNYLEFSPEVDPDVSISTNYHTAIVQRTCRDVGPGESCIASCPSSVESSYGSSRYTKYLSGGACSTSDIVEADALVSSNTYKCTVPTFSGEVVAQAICVLYD